MNTTTAYKILHRVTEQGFDVAGVSVYGVSVVLKTLTPLETDTIRYLSFGGGFNKFRMLRMAYATFVCNGRQVLKDREKGLGDLVSFYESMPVEQFHILEETAVRIQSRYRRYCALVEGYAYSPAARILWKTRGGSSAITDEVTGIPGTTYVGIAESVEAWALVNLARDIEESARQETSNAMFIASASNPAGVKKLSSRHETDQKMVEEERGTLVKYGSQVHRKFLENVDEKVKEKWTADLLTTQDIVEELNRQMNGVKDKHDTFMDGYLDGLRKKYQEEQHKKEEALEALRKARKDYPEGGSFELSAEDTHRLRNKEVSLGDLARQRLEVPQQIDGVVTSVGKRVLGKRETYGE